MVVLVTGANGQLGQSLQSVSGNYPGMDFLFYGSQQLDISDKAAVNEAFARTRPDYCINAAAYTAVDKAETESAKARQINVEGAENIAQAAKEHGTVVLHISTDFVFDGNQTVPYTELDTPNPTGVYGQTKLDGEKAISNILDKCFIVRTSWVYSQFGHNFMKTMLRLATERDTLSVVDDQIGTPTNAVDLAEALLDMIQFCAGNPNSVSYGIYNFSNEGQCSWFDFAKKIFEINKIKIDLQPIQSIAYPTPASRPAFSVLDKSKIKAVFGIQINNWETSLKK
ncbi:dTDP-4-dehydrorhamnose reductase [Flavobacterium magnum]|uniref:dTDP-4-dehydrorhamnose reductase n=1 Tax=Flavobacterium magnum TaxID=2162713 RepID=A0A2S0RDS1_9FLAO|nr:dTDP-4-dehydrorhamnose reductase [Flavobacterium magnum]AWA29261.1 dTDP-4-dehydrorhamnose reductase [Flavobacterium magnum]